MSFVDTLYSKLPRVYLQEDNDSMQGKPLYRFLQVLSVGFDAIKADIDGSFDLLDPEKCPDRYLPFLAQSLGIEFPYDMSSAEQRRFILSSPIIYRQKGTITAFQYLARELTGQQFQARITENRDWVLKTNSTQLKLYHPSQQFNTMDSTSAYLPGPRYNKTGFNLFLVANEESQNLNRTYDRLNQLTSYFSPAGTKMLSVLVYYFADAYSHDKLGETFQFDDVIETLVETRTKPLLDSYNFESMTENAGVEVMIEKKNYDTAFTNIALYKTNSTMVTSSHMDIFDSISETNMVDAYNSSNINEASNTDLLAISSTDNYDVGTAQDNNNSDLLAENNVDTYSKRYTMEVALTNIGLYHTNKNMYTNSANTVDVITTIATGAQTVQLS